MKKNALFLLNVLLGIGSMGTVAGQQDVCGFEHQQAEYRRTHPDAKFESGRIFRIGSKRGQQPIIVKDNM